MRDVITIEIKKSTHSMLRLIGTMNHSFDDVVNQLIKDHDEINKYIKKYIDGANGKCINKVILGRAIIANHKFDCDNKCIKCGIQGPITVNQVNGKTVIEIE